MKNAETEYLLRVPYPQPTRPARPPSPQTVYRLRRAAAGNGGMLTLLCSSVQRAALCRAQGKPALAEVLDAGAQTALRHLGLVTELLACCGAEPGFFVPQGGHKIWWSAGRAPQCPKPEFLVHRALRDAQAASDLCRALAETLPAGMQPCAERMLADWEHHAALLRELLLREEAPPL